MRHLELKIRCIGEFIAKKLILTPPPFFDISAKLIDKKVVLVSQDFLDGTSYNRTKGQWGPGFDVNNE